MWALVVVILGLFSVAVAQFLTPLAQSPDDSVDTLLNASGQPPAGETIEAAPNPTHGGAPTAQGAIVPVSPEQAQVRHDLRPNAPPVIPRTREEAEAMRQSIREQADEQLQDRLRRNAAAGRN